MATIKSLQFDLQITCDGAAFDTDNSELARVLRAALGDSGLATLRNAFEGY